MKTLADESKDVLAYAFEHGIVDSDLVPFDPPSIPPEMFAFAESQRSTYEKNPHEFNLLNHPKSRRFQESSFDVVTQPDVAEYWAVELARIIVPQGSIGFLETLEQVLNDSIGSYYPTNQDYWGSPHFVISDVDNCRWFLTIDYYDGLQPARFEISGATPIDGARLPGMPYSELFEINGLWYPAGSQAANNMRLIVPEQHMLRFFFVTPPTATYTWQVRGRLRAYTQTTYCKEAANNARLDW